MAVMLWLDDLRPAPAGWVACPSVNSACRLMESEVVGWVSLDHDLGDFASEGGDGPRFTDWMAEHDRWPTHGLRVHSANFAGAQTMLRTVDTYSPFPVAFGHTRGEHPAGGWPPVPRVDHQTQC